MFETISYRVGSLFIIGLKIPHGISDLTVFKLTNPWFISALLQFCFKANRSRRLLDMASVDVNSRGLVECVCVYMYRWILWDWMVKVIDWWFKWVLLDRFVLFFSVHSLLFQAEGSVAASRLQALWFVPVCACLCACVHMGFLRVLWFLRTSLNMPIDRLAMINCT